MNLAVFICDCVSNTLWKFGSRVVKTEQNTAKQNKTNQSTWAREKRTGNVASNPPRRYLLLTILIVKWIHFSPFLGTLRFRFVWFFFFFIPRFLIRFLASFTFAIWLHLGNGIHIYVESSLKTTIKHTTSKIIPFKMSEKWRQRKMQKTHPLCIFHHGNFKQ